MKRNMGTVDRLVRVAAVTALVLISWTVFGFGSVGGIVLLVVAGFWTATAVVGICPAVLSPSGRHLPAAVHLDHFTRHRAPGSLPATSAISTDWRLRSSPRPSGGRFV